MNYDGYMDWKKLWDDSSFETDEDENGDLINTLYEQFQGLEHELELADASDCTVNDDGGYTIIWSKSFGQNECDPNGSWYGFIFRFDSDMNVTSIEVDQG